MLSRSIDTLQACEISANALLRRYQDGTGFADCYCVDIPGTVSHTAYMEAFYTSSLFKIERVLLGCLAGKPATDADARDLARGHCAEFSAWRVEARTDSELLLADLTGRTRSWLMVSTVVQDAGQPCSRMYFGSAVVPAPARPDVSKTGMGMGFHALLGFHRLYSRLLLSAARARVLTWEQHI
jgi:hypothetical protein